MPGRADRSGVSKHHHARLVAVEARVVDPRGEIVDVLEDDRLALVLEESRIGGGDLHHRAVRAQASAKHDERAAGIEGIVGGAG